MRANVQNACGFVKRKEDFLPGIPNGVNSASLAFLAVLPKSSNLVVLSPPHQFSSAGQTQTPFSLAPPRLSRASFLQVAAKQAAAAATQTIAASQNAAISNKNTAAHQQLVQSCKVRPLGLGRS